MWIYIYRSDIDFINNRLKESNRRVISIHYKEYFDFMSILVDYLLKKLKKRNTSHLFCSYTHQMLSALSKPILEYHLKILESVYIKSNKPSLYKQKYLSIRVMSTFIYNIWSWVLIFNLCAYFLLSSISWQRTDKPVYCFFISCCVSLDILNAPLVNKITNP